MMFYGCQRDWGFDYPPAAARGAVALPFMAFLGQCELGGRIVVERRVPPSSIPWALPRYTIYISTRVTGHPQS